MKSTMNSILCIIVIVVSSCFTYTGCTSYTADSRWCNGDVHIDGIDEGKEWENAKYFFEYEDVSLGIKNDDRYLYLIFTTHDRNQQVRLVAQGLTIWVNEKGGRGKTLGIHFPIGMRGDSKDVLNDRNSSSAQEYDRDFQQRLLAATELIEIISHSRNARTTFTPRELDSLGIKAAIGYSKGTIVYELQIPLLHDETRRYGIGAQKMKAVGIGLDSPVPSSESSGSQRKGRGGDGSSEGGRTGGRSGGMGGGGGRGGGMGGDRGGMSSKARQTLELWLKAHLAEKIS